MKCKCDVGDTVRREENDRREGSFVEMVLQVFTCIIQDPGHSIKTLMVSSS